MKATIKITAIVSILITLLVYISGFGAPSITSTHLLVIFFGVYFFSKISRTKIQPLSRPSLKATGINLGVFLFLMSAVFIYQFWHFKEFGLYEGDFQSIAFTFDWNWHDFRSHILYTLFNSHSLDVFGDLLRTTLAFLGYQIGSLSGLYLFSMIIPASISYLIFQIIRKLMGHDFPAVLGALLFVFFPAYRTPHLLFLTFSKQVGLLLMLISFYSYLQKRSLFYIFFMLTSIITAREFAPLFLFFPLFHKTFGTKHFWKSWLKHIWHTAPPVLILFSILSIPSNTVLFNQSTCTFLMAPISFHRAFYEGAINNGFRNFALSPVTLLDHFSFELLIVFLTGWFAISIILILIKPNPNLQEQSFTIENPLMSMKVQLSVDQDLVKVLKAVLAGLILMVFSFTGYDNQTPINIYGSSSSYTYLVSVLPTVIIFAGIMTILLLLANKGYQKIILIVLLAGFLSLLGVDRYFLQEKWGQAWRIEQWIWTNVLVETEILSDETLLAIHYEATEISSFFNRNRVEVFLGNDVLPYLIFPHSDWNNFPEVMMTRSQFSVNALEEFKNPQRLVEIFIIDNQMTVEEKIFEAAPGIQVHNPTPISDLEKKKLYDLIFVEDFIDLPLSQVIQSELTDAQ